MDVIGNFIRAMCVQDEGVQVKAREMFRCYQEWSDENNEHVVSERLLGLHLKELGLEQKRSGDGRYWQGIGLKADE
jgi:putative DNA primase/helicase